MNKSLILAVAFCLAAVPALAYHDDRDTDARADYYFDQMDVNDDGIVSVSEYDTYMDRKFLKADTNADNMLSRDEVRTYKRMEHDRKGHSDYTPGSRVKNKDAMSGIDATRRSPSKTENAIPDNR